VCAICGRILVPDATGATATEAFCSARCRSIDLGRWLGERYRIVVAARESDEQLDEPPADHSIEHRRS
jgi:hypothetical protein